MKYGFVAFGKMNPEITGDNVKAIMKKVVKIAEKYDINVIISSKNKEHETGCST